MILLRVADPNCHVFGSNAHKYETRPTLTEAELQAYENANGVALPEDYRWFLRNITNGGVGPYYGMIPLDACEGDPSKPFPFSQGAETLSGEEIQKIYGDKGCPGALAICHQGCDWYAFLVVNGPAYGTIWNGGESFYPTGLSFSAWYHNWAQGALRQLRNS